MAAVRLNRRITFQARAAAAGDAYGVTEGAWEDVLGPVWAEVKPARGGEEVLAQRLTGVVACEITIRSSTDSRAITAGHRAVDDASGEVWNIRSVVNPDMRGRFLLMTAEKGVAT